MDDKDRIAFDGLRAQVAALYAMVDALVVTHPNKAALKAEFEQALNTTVEVCNSKDIHPLAISAALHNLNRMRDYLKSF